MIDPTGMGVENMRPKHAGKLAHGKGPKRPRHKGKMERSHRMKQFTKKMKRQRRS